jgi:hypothetical protein
MGGPSFPATILQIARPNRDFLTDGKINARRQTKASAEIADHAAIVHVVRFLNTGPNLRNTLIR